MNTNPVEEQPTKVVAFRDAQWKTQWLFIGLAVLLLLFCTRFIDYGWLLQLPWGLLFLIVAGLATEVFFLIFPIVTRNQHQPHSFNFQPKTNYLLEFGIAILLVIVAIIIITATSALVGRILPGTTLTSETFNNIAVSPNHMYVYLILLFTFTFAPIAEEIFFRGFLYNAFRARMPWLVASLIQSLIFGFSHLFGGIHVVDAFIIGMLLTAIYEWRKTLITPIFVHAGINFVSALSIILMMAAIANGPVIGVTGSFKDTSCVIRQIVPDSAAEASNLQIDDIITAFDGVPIRNIQHLIKKVSQYQPGDEVPITINRAGKVFEVNIVLRKRKNHS